MTVRSSALLLLFLPVAVLRAQSPAYRPGMLDGARFQQTIRSQIRTEAGNRVSQERSGREGTIDMRAVMGDSGIQLESWFESLNLWRESGDERYAPDTDGLIGGRYRGRLSADGRYQWLDQPFIPDQLSELAELGSALDDLLPPVPAADLKVGAAVSAADGWRIERQPDSSAEGRVLRRYLIAGERRRAEVGALIDSLPVEASTYEKETGTMIWDPEQGPLRWLRQITLTAALPAKGAIRRPVRTQIEQSVLLERLGPGESRSRTSPP